MKTFISLKTMAVEKQANALNGTPINEVDAYFESSQGIKKVTSVRSWSGEKSRHGSSSSSSSRNSSGRCHRSEMDQLREELRRDKEESIRNERKLDTMQAQLDEMCRKFANPTDVYVP